MDPIKRAITTWLYRLVIESPPAHALLLRIYMVSEGFHHRFVWFNRPELVDDPELQLLMRQHFADEDNHAKYMKLGLTFKGESHDAPPLHLDYLVLLAAAFWEQGILLGDDLADLTGPRLFRDRQNLFVQLAFKDLSEKRAIGEFHIWRDLAKTRDPEVYAILKRVVEDEDWHVHIFDTQVHRMMADPEHGPHLRRVYKHLVAVSRRVANQASANFLSYLLDEGLLTPSWPERLAMRSLIALQRLGGYKLPLERAAQLVSLQDPAFTATPPQPSLGAAS